MVGFYSTRGSPPVMVDLQVKVVDSLSPCFRGDFPESVTADRYVTSEWEDPWKHLKNGKPWAPHHPWTCESSPQSPQTETYSTVNTTRARCEDVTSECSRPQTERDTNDTFYLWEYQVWEYQVWYLILSKVSSTSTAFNFYTRQFERGSGKSSLR